MLLRNLLEHSDPFVRGYASLASWHLSLILDQDLRIDTPIADATAARILADCVAFQAAHRDTLDNCPGVSYEDPLETAGEGLYQLRNSLDAPHSGTLLCEFVPFGLWDLSYLDAKERHGHSLDAYHTLRAAARSMGPWHLVLRDDGIIGQQG